MGIYVTFWGVRGSIPTPGHATQRYGGNTACIEVIANDNLFILDGGSGLRPLGMDLLQRRKTSQVFAHLLFSHSHWDHIQGFPFFVPAYNPKTVMKIYGTHAEDRAIYDLLHGQMQNRYFPVQFNDLGSQIVPDHLDHGKREISGVVVDFFKTKHPGGSLAYSISDGTSKIVYSTDNELDLMLLNREESLKNPNVFRQAPADLIEFLSGADLLIADGQYTDEEYPTKINWGHARANTLVDVAKSANVKNLAITHHDPMHSDENVDQKITDCRHRAQSIGYSGVIFGAREGVTLKYGT